jgi:hypothetical protein
MKRLIAGLGLTLALLAGPASAPGQGRPAAEMGHAGPVRRLLRRPGERLLRGGRPRRGDQAGRARHRSAAGDRRRRRRRDRRLDAVALASREKGVPLVNIAQPFTKSGLMLTCRKETGITKPEDFKGKTLGVWFFGNEYPFLSWMSKLGLPTEGGAEGRDRGEAGLQRRSADPEAGGLHLHHDL